MLAPPPPTTTDFPTAPPRQPSQHWSLPAAARPRDAATAATITTVVVEFLTDRASTILSSASNTSIAA